MPVTVYVAAETPQEAQDAALALVASASGPDGPLSTALFPVELTQDQADSHRRFREILAQADRKYNSP